MKTTYWRIDNYNQRKYPMDMLILHATNTASVRQSVDCFLKNETSAHYIVDRNGEIFSMVPEDKRAWHAGTGFDKSAWQDRDDINSRSIGIEFQSDFPFQFTDDQKKAGIELIADIVRRCAIPPQYVLGHSDIAPHRKMDPGALFFWAELAEKGIGLYPLTDLIKAPENLDVVSALQVIGYRPDLYGRQLCEKAFADHFIGASGRPFHDTLWTVKNLFEREYHGK